MTPAIITICLFLVYAAVPTDSAGCPSRDVTFELTTGFVFRSPSDLLETRPGVLLLEECLDHCLRNDSCLALNYETGLCVLFTSSAELKPSEYAYVSGPVLDHRIVTYLFDYQMRRSRALYTIRDVAFLHGISSIPFKTIKNYFLILPTRQRSSLLSSLQPGMKNKSAFANDCGRWSAGKS